MTALGDLIIEQWDASSMHNVGEGNPLDVWYGELGRVDLAAPVGHRPTYHTSDGPSDQPSAEFVATTYLDATLTGLTGPNPNGLVNGFMAFIASITAGGSVYGSVNDHAGVNFNYATENVSGANTLYEGWRTPLGTFASRTQLFDTNYHTIIFTWYFGQAQIYVDGTTGVKDASVWTPTAGHPLNFLTLGGFIPSSLGIPGMRMQAMLLGKQALPDPGAGAGNPVPAGSLVGRVQAYLKAKYGTP